MSEFNTFVSNDTSVLSLIISRSKHDKVLPLKNSNSILVIPLYLAGLQSS